MVDEPDNLDTRQASDGDYLLAGSSTHQARKGKRGCPSFEISVPLTIPSSNRSSSSCSLDEGAQDTTAGYDTLATTTEATPTGSDFSNTASKRVSASQRALELRTSVFALNHLPESRKRSIKSLVADDSLSETSDACLARIIQEDEYNDSSLKKPRLSTISNNEKYEIQNSTDDNDNILSEPSPLEDNLLSKHPYTSRATVKPGTRFCSRRIIRDRVSKTVIPKVQGTISDSADSLLSEPDSDISGPGHDVGGMEDTYHGRSSSEYSSTTTYIDDDALIEPARNSRQNQRTRASLTRPMRAPLMSPLASGGSRLGSRVRRISSLVPKKQLIGM